MRIDNHNAEIINTKSVYIHDDILEQMLFDRLHSELKLFVTNNMTEQSYIISFCNVIGFEMSSCDFWGASPHILDFEYVEANDCTLVSKLMKKAKENEYFCKLTSGIEYIETKLTFTSGDQLTIACEFIIL